MTHYGVLLGLLTLVAVVGALPEKGGAAGRGGQGKSADRQGGMPSGRHEDDGGHTRTLYNSNTLNRTTAVDVAAEMKPLVEAMIQHAFHSYVHYAFPQDEIRPIDGTGQDTLGSYALTLIDALDLLALSGMHDEFRTYSRWVQDHISFDIDKHVSVFETSIRILGGLLSAHFMYEAGVVDVQEAVDDYDGGLLRLAVDLGERLLPAFSTPTGIPYGSINLRHGVASDEIDITSTAGGGTFLLEMTILSAVTGDDAFERAARRATLALVQHRVSSTDLVGNHINITSGQWSLDLSSVGSGVDSLVEYLLKGYLMTGDPQLYKSYSVLHDAFAKYTRRGPWFVEVTTQGQLAHPLHNSLAAFYPGNVALSGRHLPEAVESCFATHFVLKRVGAIPEGYHVGNNELQNGQVGYPLRPEHAESLYMLYRTTGDPAYLEMGKEFALMLWTRTATRCGFAALKDCSLPPSDAKYTDAMESFVLAETLKYLYLLFDTDNALHRVSLPSHGRAGPVGIPMWVFNTEGHPLPLSDEWRWWRLYAEREQEAASEEKVSPVLDDDGNSDRVATEQADDASLMDRIARKWREATADSDETRRQRWHDEKRVRDNQRDALLAAFDNEYSAWNSHPHTDALAGPSSRCSEGRFDCLFDAAEFPQSSPMPTQRTVHVERMRSGGLLYRVHDVVETMDAAFQCTARQTANDFDKLSKTLYHRPFDV